MKSSEKATRVVAATLILLVGVAVVGGGGFVSHGAAAVECPPPESIPSDTVPCTPTSDPAPCDPTITMVTPCSGAFVQRSGPVLSLNGQPYRFTGINMYDANNRAGCGTVMSDADLGAAFDSIGAGRVVRAWFFQSLATSGGQRDWTGFDRTVAVATSHGIKLIPTLANQWPDCDGPAGGAGVYKTRQWYESGYATDVLPGSTVSYRSWVEEVVARYAGVTTIAAWQLVNEAEVYTVRDAGCPDPAGAGMVLHDFAADVSALVKSTDPNHLVSLGVIGSGQCGADNDNYRLVHSVPGIDLCEFHDYGSPNVAIPGDRWNGLAERIRQCRLLDKPLFIGESGITLPEAGGSATTRAEKFAAKMDEEFRVGVVGYLAWAWQGTPSPTTYDIGPGDPVLATLAQQFPDDGGDSDGDGVTNAVDAGTGFDDHAGTWGSVVDAQGQYVVIMDAAAPAGVRVYIAPACCGQLPVQLSLCGANQTLPYGTDTVLTCPRQPLTVSKVGTGTGTVTSSPSGLSCGSTCSATFDQGASVTLTATADAGSTFAGWSGPDANSCLDASTCTVTMSVARAVTATFVQPRTWASAAPMSKARSNQTATRLQNGSVLVVGGASGTPDRADVYDPRYGTWTLTGNVTTRSSGHTATLLVDGRVLITGGTNVSSAPVARTDLYNPSTNAWTNASPMTSARLGHTATLLGNGTVLVAGGNNAAGATGTTEIYNPSTGTWTRVGQMITPRRGHTATLLANGTVLVAGGTRTGSAALASAEIYTPSTRAWTAVPTSMPSPLVGHTAIRLSGGRVVIAGGAVAVGGTPRASVVLYNPQTRAWATGPSLSIARTGHTATLLSSGDVLIAGGTRSTGPTPTAETYTVSTGVWSQTRPMAGPRTAHTATILTNGTVLVTGGNSGTGVLATAQTYWP